MMDGAGVAGESASGFALIEMAFSFGVVLAIAFWQWWQVRKPEPPDSSATPPEEPEA